VWTILMAATGIGATILWSHGQESLSITLLYVMGVFALILVNNLRKRAEKQLQLHNHSRRS